MLLTFTVAKNEAQDVIAALRAIGFTVDQTYESDEFSTFDLNWEDSRDPSPRQAVELAIAVNRLFESWEQG